MHRCGPSLSPDNRECAASQQRRWCAIEPLEREPSTTSTTKLLQRWNPFRSHPSFDAWNWLLPRRVRKLAAAAFTAYSAWGSYISSTWEERGDCPQRVNGRLERQGGRRRWFTKLSPQRTILKEPDQTRSIGGEREVACRRKAELRLLLDGCRCVLFETIPCRLVGLRLKSTAVARA